MNRCADAAGGPVKPSSTAYAARLRLSRRQSQVLDALATGRPYKDAARALHISYSTFRTHTEKIRTKAGLKTTRQVVAAILRPTIVGEAAQASPGSCGNRTSAVDARRRRPKGMRGATKAAEWRARRRKVARRHLRTTP